MVFVFNRQELGRQSDIAKNELDRRNFVKPGVRVASRIAVSRSSSEKAPDAPSLPVKRLLKAVSPQTFLRAGTTGSGRPGVERWQAKKVTRSCFPDRRKADSAPRNQKTSTSAILTCLPAERKTAARFQGRLDYGEQKR